MPKKPETGPKKPKLKIKSIDHAKSLDLKILSKANTAALVKEFGIAKSALPPNCGELMPGEKCFEGPCIDGWRIVMFCDGSNGCTKSTKVPC
jgi:hypothetical protein